MVEHKFRLVVNMNTAKYPNSNYLHIRLKELGSLRDKE
jgi:hypothetical protein